MGIENWRTCINRFMGRAVVEPLKEPTGKQKEAYARFLHALSAACFIGAVSVTYGAISAWVILRSAVLSVLGVVIFLCAAPLAKG